MKALALFAGGALALSFFLGGGAPLGRVLIAAGLPAPAAPFFASEDWKGVALFRAGAFTEAAAAFRAAGDAYNLGLAEAYAGQDAAALEAWDVAIRQGDARARANFDVLAAFYAGMGIDPDALIQLPPKEEGARIESHVAEGSARAAGTGSDVTNANTMLGLAELDSRGELGVRRVFDERFMIADTRWLAQLSDVPGAYMQARIRHEHKRRQSLGLSPPDPEDPR